MPSRGTKPQSTLRVLSATLRSLADALDAQAEGPPEPAAAHEPRGHPDDRLTLTESALYTRQSVSTLKRAIRAGSLTSTKPSGRRLVRRADLDAWLDSGARR
jgi:excisionase family DNA binding protein